MTTAMEAKKIKNIRWRYEHGALLYENVIEELISQIHMTQHEAVKLVSKWIESWPRD